MVMEYAHMMTVVFSVKLGLIRLIVFYFQVGTIPAQELHYTSNWNLLGHCSNKNNDNQE
jgi:hypothetical protein